MICKGKLRLEENRKMEQPEYVSLEFGKLPTVDGGGGWRIAKLYLYSFINLISLFSRECIKVSDFIEVRVFNYLKHQVAFRPLCNTMLKVFN